MEGDVGQFADLKGARLNEKEGRFRRVDTPMHTMLPLSPFTLKPDVRPKNHH